MTERSGGRPADQVGAPQAPESLAGATAALADIVLARDADSIPDRAREEAVRSITDALGVGLAGVTSRASSIVTAFVEREGARGGCVVIGAGFRAQPAMAALANGTTMHALDFDDTTPEIGHPSAAVVPAALAVAEATGASGREFVDACVIGFEVAARLGRAAGYGPLIRGYHGTSILGVFGATAAAARLLALDARSLSNAFGIAASEASGLSVNFGTDAKPYHAGECNRAGVASAYLARDGFVASGDAIGAKKGWGAVVAGDGFDSAKLTEALGGPLVVEGGFRIKRYPCCGFNHTAIAVIGELMQREGLAPDDVETVEARASRTLADVVGCPWPASGLEGKFSLAYNVAEAWRRGTVTVESFSDERLAELDPFRQRVSIVPVDAPHDGPLEVTMHLKDGRSVSHELRDSSRDARNPDDRELDEKFRSNVGRAGRHAHADVLLALSRNVLELQTLDELTTLLA